MVLKIKSIVMKCPLLTQLDHENNTEHSNHKLATVKEYWVKNYKAHKKYNHNQARPNLYESAAFTVQPPSPATSISNNYNTYILTLEDVIAHQMVDCEDALAVSEGTVMMAGIMAEMKKRQIERKKGKTSLIATAMLAATSNNVGGGTSVGTNGGQSSG